jgi:DNA-directed RNA polymerase beta subunit
MHQHNAMMHYDGLEFVGQHVRENIVNHHIRGFNHLITSGLQEIINREPPVRGIKFGAIHVDKPCFVDMNRQTKPMFPSHARKRNETYEGVVSINIIYNGKETQRVPIGKIPIMLRSIVCNLASNNLFENEECYNDKGGYFVIKGKERVLVSQMRPAFNRVYTYQSKVSDSHKYFSEIRSMNDSGLSILVQAMVDERFTCTFSLPYIKTNLPVGLVFRALDVDIELVIKWIGCRNKRFNNTLMNQYHEYETSEIAIQEIANRLPSDCEGSAIDYINGILSNELFYHIGSLTHLKSAMHLAYVLKRLLAVATGSLAVDDKHNLSNKRVETSGTLVAFIFNGLFKQFMKTLSNQMNEKIESSGVCVFDPVHLIRSINNITYGMVGCFMASNWTTQKSSNTFSREGVSQVLSIKNYGARLSHLRRVMLPNGVKGKNASARLLHSSHYGFLCPYETPEGERIGLTTNLSLSANISLPIPSHEVQECGLFEGIDEPYVGRFLILLNGTIVGSCNDCLLFMKKFDEYRQNKLIEETVSLVWQRYANEIHIWSDEGRLYRPVFKVDKSNNVVIPRDFKSGIADDIVVFRDVQELEQAVVAMNFDDLKRNRCHYMEISPALVFSIMGSVIPFPDRCQSPRIGYQSNMGKQAIGYPLSTCLLPNARSDTTMHVLNYPQQPMTKTKTVNVLHFDEMPHGFVPIVAIMTFNGFNQEDSLILNHGSIQRGMASITEYNTITEEERKRGNTDYETICLPKIQYRKHDINYTHLSESGVVKNDRTIYLKAGDAIVGKTRVKTIKNITGVKETKTEDVTVTVTSGEEGHVDSVTDIINSEGVRVIKVRMRKLMIPEIGDKFASSCAQKGTCGMIYSQEDMPFDANGVCPDLIINPHAIPSRMTINMLIEQILNKIGCQSGKFQDASPFEHPDIANKLKEEMIKYGIVDYLGRPAFKQQLFSGTTGKKLPHLIFMGPAYYQRLCHIVAKKIHARMAGPVDAITRIPVGGRQKKGAFRIGAMEIAAIIASGCSGILRTLMYDQSDTYVLPVCIKCGQIPLSTSYCRQCENDGVIVKKITPYATKLFYQLLMGHGIKLKIT